MVIFRESRGGLSASIAFIAGSDTATAGVVEFYGIGGTSVGNSVEENNEIRHIRSGSMLGMNIMLDNNSRDGVIIYVLRINGADTAGLITIPIGIAGLFDNTTDRVAFVKDDECAFRWDETDGTVGSARIEGRATVFFT